MTEESRPDKETAQSDNSNLDGSKPAIPKAQIRTAEQVATGRLRTKLWWLTGICTLLATALVVSSFQSQGTLIAIRFEEGHGLKAGDTLRYRGIDVGSVQSVKIAPDMQSVETQILLGPGNEAIAVEGSKFWIERPRLRLGQIGGLETVVGAKYVGVSPGDPSGVRILEFEGLENPLTIAQGDSREIVVVFPRGDGLAAGDSVRYRGIAVGEVTSVELGENSESVEVGLRLIGAARNLARMGTQFWIERPRLDLTEIRGLDTLLGGLYIAMEPAGEDGQLSDRFVGLSEAPPLPLRDGSLEIQLDAASRMGISRGAPIAYRGLEVGRVSAVDLSSDGASVKVHAVIEPEYAELVRDNSKWWSNGGIQVDAKLSGVEITMDSVDAWLRGGIAFGTPESPGKNVVTGHRFVLEPEPLPEWLEWQPRIAVSKTGGLELPEAFRIVSSWSSGMIGLYRRHTDGTWGIATDDGYLWVPTEFVDKAEEVEREVQIEVAGKAALLESGNILRGNHVSRIRLPTGADVPRWSRSNRGEWTSDSVLLIANPSLSEPIALDSTRIARDKTGILKIAVGVPISSSLTGSPVVEASEGRLVGLLLQVGGAWAVASVE
ncbi:MAG: MlaD family protein [Planctomycetota bacterium]